MAKLSKKCQGCPFVDKCKNKRMEALAHVSSNTENLVAPVSRETMTIMVNDTPMLVYKDEIEKQLYYGLGLQFIQTAY